MIDPDEYWNTAWAMGRRLEEQAAAKLVARKRVRKVMPAQHVAERLEGGCLLYRLPTPGRRERQRAPDIGHRTSL